VETEAILAISGIVGTLLFFVLIFLPSILRHWHLAKVESARAEAEAANAALKREMVERGFTADEITRVVNSGSMAVPPGETSCSAARMRG